MKDTEPEVLFVNEERDRYEAKTDEGFILLSRSFVESSIFFQKEPVLRVALYLMTRANWKPGKWYCNSLKREILVDRGQIVTSITKITSLIPMLSRHQVRLALEKLKSCGFIKDITPEPEKRANAFLLLSIEKYGVYQDQRNYYGQRLTNEPTTNRQRTDTIEEGNNLIREEYNTYIPVQKTEPTNGPSKPKKKPRFKFPDDLAPSTKLQEFAVKHHCRDLTRMVLMCRDWHWKKGELVADPEAAVRTFILRDEKQQDPKSVKYVATFDEDGRF